MKKQKVKKLEKNAVQKITIVFICIFIISTMLFSVLCYINYKVDNSNLLSDDTDNVNVPISQKKEIISALVCGVNDNLTDTIIYVRYNSKTGKIAMMSIPRDTYVDNDYCIGHKINAIYRGKNAVPLVQEVEEILDVDIDYYLFFEADMLRDMVDAIGGVEIDVAMRMKYDDPTQNLHIDLYPGVQVLDGSKAEQYVRFRSNNDYTVGYRMGDVDRTKVQQEFIKKFIKTALSVNNISKAPQLINIASKNTNTNVTVREALKYVTDLSKIDFDNIYSTIMPHTPKYINGLSYVIIDEEDVKEEINNNFKSLDT